MDIAPIGIAGRALSDQSQALIVEHAMKQKRSVRKVAEILGKGSERSPDRTEQSTVK